MTRRQRSAAGFLRRAHLDTMPRRETHRKFADGNAFPHGRGAMSVFCWKVVSSYLSTSKKIKLKGSVSYCRCLESARSKLENAKTDAPTEIYSASRCPQKDSDRIWSRLRKQPRYQTRSEPDCQLLLRRIPHRRDDEISVNHSGWVRTFAPSSEANSLCPEATSHVSFLTVRRIRRSSPQPYL